MCVGVRTSADGSAFFAFHGLPISGCAVFGGAWGFDGVSHAWRLALLSPAGSVHRWHVLTALVSRLNIDVDVVARARPHSRSLPVVYLLCCLLLFRLSADARRLIDTLASRHNVCRVQLVTCLFVALL